MQKLLAAILISTLLTISLTAASHYGVSPISPINQAPIITNSNPTPRAEVAQDAFELTKITAEPTSTQTTPSQPKVIVLAPSTEEDTDGNPDRPVVTGNVYNAETKSSGTVIIKGSSIKENYPDKDHDDWIEVLSSGSKSDSDLKLYAAAITATNNDILEITLRDSSSTSGYNEVDLNFIRRVKILGFIPYSYKGTAKGIINEEIYPDKVGRVKVQFHWSARFFGDESREFDVNLIEGGSNSRMQQLMQTMSNISK